MEKEPEVTKEEFAKQVLQELIGELCHDSYTPTGIKIKIEQEISYLERKQNDSIRQ